MLEINHVNLPRPHENAQFHICGRSFSFALPAVHCRARYVGREMGVLYLTGCHPNNVRNKRRATQQPKVTQLTLV